ncbi:hypothetical protein Cgig2_031672 [Carnegiea gigantea]|uniref:Reverse transcriptase zinc-binding domain-containing protein n=1 Tax=Carnegiea gigantea TaxID=171969 RepID=A0A9Q1KRL7_9CARY|nr:hypothetical protein Cgig2_031672 [Carnegiea gigantea]
MVVEERLDRFYANTNWFLLFPNAQVFHIDFDLSDHMPVLLKCKARAATDCNRKRRFQFENMWLMEPSCGEVISSAWSSVYDLDPVDNAMGRHDACAGELQCWNKDFFGHVTTKISKLEKQFASQRDAPSRRALLQQIRDWRTKEEILWWQRARSDCLKYGDSNMRWVCDLIDTQHTAWHADLVKRIFLPIDVAIILDIPLCASWPDDKLVWHYTSDGSFTVRSAYHMINASKCAALGSSSRPSREVWRTIWSLRIPPRIKLFGWCLCKGIIPSGYNISKRDLEETDAHSLLECPLAVLILEGSDLDTKL